MMSFVIRPIAEAEVRQLIGWRYEPPYDVYNIVTTDIDGEVRWFLLPENAYHAILQDGDLIGFCCYGADARVPGGDYRAEALDVGLGLRPDLTGQGLGSQILEAVLSAGKQAFAPLRFRATIVAWNRRSIRTFEKLVFARTATFSILGNPTGDTWVQLVRDV